MNDYLKKRQDFINAGRPLKKKEPYYIPKKSAKLIAKEKQEKVMGSDIGLDGYFQHHMEKSDTVCMNCGMRADWLKEPKYELIWRACQAHILPKKKSMFPSLASNLDNHLILFPSWGGHLCGCHGWFDSNWYNATTMEVWKIAVEIFRDKLYPIIPENEKRKIPEQLLKEIQ